jgi:hypothetical protein
VGGAGLSDGGGAWEYVMQGARTVSASCRRDVRQSKRFAGAQKRDELATRWWPAPGAAAGYGCGDTQAGATPLRRSCDGALAAFNAWLLTRFPLLCARAQPWYGSGANVFALCVMLLDFTICTVCYLAAFGGDVRALWTADVSCALFTASPCCHSVPLLTCSRVPRRTPYRSTDIDLASLYRPSCSVLRPQYTTLQGNLPSLARGLSPRV